jgi:hypothetical protein
MVVIKKLTKLQNLIYTQSYNYLKIEVKIWYQNLRMIYLKKG